MRKAVGKLFDFRPRAIVETLDLLRPIYRPTAAYGHFGRSEKTFTWENADRAAELAEAVLGSKAKTRNGATNGSPRPKKKAAKKAASKSKSASASR